MPTPTRPIRRSLAALGVVWFVAFASGVACVVHAEVAVAELTPEMEHRAQEIIRTTMSPFCPGRTLDSCPSPNATDWRNDVREWVEQGVSTPEIRKRLMQRVPEVDITGAPSTALDAVLPILVTVTAVLLLALLLRKLLVHRERARSAAPKGAAAPEDSAADKRELDRRLDEELSRLDE